LLHLSVRCISCTAIKLAAQRSCEAGAYCCHRLVHPPEIDPRLLTIPHRIIYVVAFGRNTGSMLAAAAGDKMKSKLQRCGIAALSAVLCLHANNGRPVVVVCCTYERIGGVAPDVCQTEPCLPFPRPTSTVRPSGLSLLLHPNRMHTDLERERMRCCNLRKKYRGVRTVWYIPAARVAPIRPADCGLNRQTVYADREEVRCSIGFASLDLL